MTRRSPFRRRPRGITGRSFVYAVILGLMIGWYAPQWRADPPRERAGPWSTSASAPASGSDQLSARFGFCHSGGVNCVVDGDTFWFGGDKYRIADIDAPETHGPRCAAEGVLGARATTRLQDLLNAGPFTLESGDRDADRYGRALRVVSRDGASIGGILVTEGLARTWDGARHPWC